MSIYKNAFKDVVDALNGYPLWVYMAGSDIRLRYRGSTLGPIWITISMIIFIGSLSVVYSRLLKQEINYYIPYLTCGLLLWTYISTVITESSEIFMSSKEFIEGMKIPYFLFIMRMIWRNFLIFLHNFVVYLLVIWIFPIKLNFYILLAIPGFILVTANLAAISLIISLIGTRFRDLPPIITAAITVVFFVSPITWQSKMIGNDSLIIKLNPISYFLDLVRSPLLGLAPHMSSVFFCLILFLVLSACAFRFFAHKRIYIPFWL
ncbi:MAG: ABC transporter permease [Proteobacteria bacterium]|nr:ABC transporter permease [Pseudomonadota bacterium]